MLRKGAPFCSRWYRLVVFAHVEFRHVRHAVRISEMPCAHVIFPEMNADQHLAPETERKES